MTLNKSDYEYCIEVERGKYHVVLTKDYHVKYLRHGEDWLDNLPGSKMMIALMTETERKEEEIVRLRKALEYYADEKRYEPYAVIDVNPCDITEDGGYIAREALKQSQL